jgi:tetratricopeptide (TPR) repeat protein
MSFIPRFLIGWASIGFALTSASSVGSAQEVPGGAANQDQARSAMMHGDYPKAERLYRAAMEKHPTSATLLTDLGITLQMQGRASEAIHEFEQALKLNYAPRTYALLAEERCISRDLDGARPMVSKIIREYAGETNIIAIVAPCYLDLDEPIKSVKAYTILLRDDTYPRDRALIQLAKSFLAATQYFVTQLRSRPASGTYLTALSEASVSGNARGAFPFAQQASLNFHADQGFDATLTIWHQHQDDPALLYQLAVISGEESMRQIQLCNEQYPNSPYLAQLQFEMLADEGREDEAASGFEGLLQSHPELPDLRYLLGMLYRKLNQWEKALTVFREELSANPRDERAAARVSEALDHLMRWTELRDFLAPRLKRADTPLWTILDFTDALEQLGEVQKAISLLSTAKAKYPSSRAVHFILLHLYRNTGEKPKAIAEAEWFKTQPK